MGYTIGQIPTTVTVPKAADWEETEQDGVSGKISFENKMKGTGSAWSLLEETPSATNPVFVIAEDEDTGIGASGADALSIIAGGKEIARAIEDTTEQFIINPQGDLPGTESAPSLAMGDGDSGFYESSDDILYLSLGGLDKWQFNENFLGSASVGGRLRFNGVSSTVTGLIPDGQDPNTGIGRASDDQLSLIAGGVELVRCVEDTIDYVSLVAPASASTPHVNGSISFYLDESGNNLKVAVKYSDGTTKTGTLALV